MSFLKQILILTKAKVIVLMMSTSYVGMLLAPGLSLGPLHHGILLMGLSAIAASGAVANQIFDREIDRKMKRTQHRPLVQEVFSLTQAIAIAIFFWFSGSAILLYHANTLTWILTSLGALGYGVIYTCFLKKASPQNIVFGGISGALPPLLGWASISNTIDPHALLLVALIFVWTPAHFWALALQRKDDYTNAAIPMLSVTHGMWFTTFSICLYTVLLIPICTLIWLTHICSWVFFTISMLLTLYYLYLNIMIFKDPSLYAPKSFRYSILYLYLLFFTMIFDRLLGFS